MKDDLGMGNKIPIEQAAKQLGISKRSLRRMISSGDLPAYRIGNLPQCVRIDADDLETVCKPIVPSGKC